MLSERNQIALLKLSAEEGRCLLPEQAELLRGELRGWAKSAGEALWFPDRGRKSVKRDVLCAWWRKRTTEKYEGASAPGGAVNWRTSCMR
jgi:hypothetical protein